MKLRPDLILGVFNVLLDSIFEANGLIKLRHRDGKKDERENQKHRCMGGKSKLMAGK